MYRGSGISLNGLVGRLPKSVGPEKGIIILLSVDGRICVGIMYFYRNMFVQALDEFHLSIIN
jgi:hypothetical protein